MIEKNFKYNMIYQLLSPVTFRDSPAHPVSFISKHGYDWLNADKQLEFWKYFSAQLESIVVYCLFHSVAGGGGVVFGLMICVVSVPWTINKYTVNIKKKWLTSCETLWFKLVRSSI